MLPLLTATLAGAGPTGFYHPEDVAAASALFRRASTHMGETFEARSRVSGDLAAALRGYRESLDALGPRAPAAEQARLDALQQSYQRQRAVLQAFANTVIEDVDDEFTQAVERAIASLEAEAVVCARAVASGPRVPGMAPRTRVNPACSGDDLNAGIAASLDADAALVGAVDEILALTWPEVGIDAAPQAGIGAGGRTVDVGRLLHEGARASLVAIDAQDDEERLVFQAAIEQGADADALKRLVGQARAVTEATAERRAQLAAPILAVAETALAGWASRGEPATAWCANPRVLGGCEGADATAELVPRLLGDKKVRRALPDP